MSGLDDLVEGAVGNAGGLGGLIGSLAGSGSTGGGLDDIIGGLTGAGGDSAGPGGMGGLLGSLLPALGGMLAGGGLQKILAGFQQNGLAAQADSWIGTGANEPISGADVRKVVSADDLEKVAAQLGVTVDEAADALAAVLPTVVDKVSPDGQLAPQGELDSTFGSLEQLAGESPATG